MDNGHSLLEDNFVCQDIKPSAKGHHVPFGSLRLALQGKNSRLPNLVVLFSNGTELGEHSLVQLVEEASDLSVLSLFSALQGFLHVARLILDVLERQSQI